MFELVSECKGKREGKAWLGCGALLGKGGTGWIEKTPLWQRRNRQDRKNTKGFSFIYRALDIMIIDISKNPQDLQLQLLEKELFSTHHNDDHS